MPAAVGVPESTHPAERFKPGGRPCEGPHTTATPELLGVMNSVSLTGDPTARLAAVEPLNREKQVESCHARSGTILESVALS